MTGQTKVPTGKIHPNTSPIKMSMWEDGITPRAPPSVPPRYTSDSMHKGCADERQSELDALRQRGLVKLLGKHFTTVTKAIEEERAAADAALRDLEARKASTPEFASSTNGTSYYEKLYMELQQQKAECKRKERETLLLYHRYVAKFCDTGVVAVPNSRDLKIGMPPALVTPDTTRKTYSYLPSHLSPSVKVSQMAGEIEENLLKHASSGCDMIPSSFMMGMGETFQSRQSDTERELSESSMRSLEAICSLDSKDVDAYASPLPTGKKLVSASQFPIPVLTFPVHQSKVSIDSHSIDRHATTPPALGVLAQDDDDDDRSMSCGLALGALAHDDYNDDRSMSCGLALGALAQDDDDNDRSMSYSLISVASEVTSETELRFLNFLTTETEIVRKMMKDEDSDSNASSMARPERSALSRSMVGTESAQAADKAEGNLRQMQNIMVDQEAPKVAELETAKPNERLIVYLDDNHQREHNHSLSQLTASFLALQHLDF